MASVSLVLISAHEVVSLIPFPGQEYISWLLYTSAFSFILVMLLMTIRNLKPEFTRYPYPFVFMPLLLLIAAPFIQAVSILMNFISILLQGGGVLVLFLLYTGYPERFKRLWLAITGLVAFIIAYILCWFMSGLPHIYSWMWQTLAAVGIFATSFTYPRLINPDEPSSDNNKNDTEQDSDR